jgi:RimJ/RimL family protein N-acetyltransferase
LITDRLRLRQWEDRDRAPFAAINADAEVMAHYPAPMTRAQSDTAVDKMMAHVDRYGFGLWAAERIIDGELLGFVGVRHIPFEADFTPALEIGWRLRRDAWGNGYATEAARVSVDYAFDVLGVPEVLAMARPTNTSSLRVMERLGMTHDPADDFHHPPLPTSGSLDYVLYRLRAATRPR